MKNKIAVIIMLFSMTLAAGCGDHRGTEAGAAENSVGSMAENPAASIAENSAGSTAEAGASQAAELPDGIYMAEFRTDSSMFRVNEACDGKGLLTVENGEMTIHISLGSKKIINLYPGLAEEAAKDGAELLQPTEDPVTYSDGMTETVYGFDVPVPVLEQEFDLALIGTKGIWYDHKVSVSDPVPVEEGAQAVGAGSPSEAGAQAVGAGSPSEAGAQAGGAGSPSEAGAQTGGAGRPSEAGTQAGGAGRPSEAGTQTGGSNPETEHTGSADGFPDMPEDLVDGVYSLDITFEGGSGKAEILSPVTVTVTDGKAMAEVQWNSPNYDYMIVGGEKYLPISTEGDSVFEIPVLCFDEPMDVIGDTVAMSKPHEVEYTITFHWKKQ